MADTPTIAVLHGVTFHVRTFSGEPRVLIAPICTALGLDPAVEWQALLRFNWWIGPTAVDDHRSVPLLSLAAWLTDLDQRPMASEGRAKLLRLQADRAALAVCAEYRATHTTEGLLAGPTGEPFRELLIALASQPAKPPKADTLAAVPLRSVRALGAEQGITPGLHSMVCRAAGMAAVDLVDLAMDPDQGAEALAELADASLDYRDRLAAALAIAQAAVDRTLSAAAHLLTKTGAL